MRSRRGGGVRRPPDAAQLQLAAIIDAASARVAAAAPTLHLHPGQVLISKEAAGETAAALRSTDPEARLRSTVAHAARRLWAWAQAAGKAAWGVVQSAWRRLYTRV